MSLLINGMEMPTSCEECQTALRCCVGHEDGTVWCRLAHDYIGDERTVCPLVPVPPHGRLIDADVLCNRLMTVWDTADKEKKTLISAVMADIVTPIVLGTPTIIPAEEGER